MDDQERPKKRIPPPDLERSEKLSDMVREDMEEQRELIRKLRRKMIKAASRN